MQTAKVTERFCEMLLEELRHYEDSGIPLRRPNGMNRFGAILDQLGLEASLDYLSRRFVRPLGQLLFPWLISHSDADEHYAFAVRCKSSAPEAPPCPASRARLPASSRRVDE